jgi:hypothetical protein
VGEPSVTEGAARSPREDRGLHHAVAGDELYHAHRDNWIATLMHLGESLAPRLDMETLHSAIREIERVSGDELLVETTVPPWGKKNTPP